MPWIETQSLGHYQKWHLQPVDSFRVYPGRVALHFVQELPTKGLQESDMEDLRDRAHAILENYLIQHDDFYKALRPEAVLTQASAPPGALPALLADLTSPSKKAPNTS